MRAWNKTLEQRVSEQLGEIERIGRLKRFLAPQIAELILSAGDERMLESHRRDITVVFCDLRGFTAFAEIAEPEEVMAVLREYHAALGELIHKYEGTLDHFTGDGMMVFFNDPLPCPGPVDASRAHGGRDARRGRRSSPSNGAATVTNWDSASASHRATPRSAGSASKAASTIPRSEPWSTSPPGYARRPKPARSSSMARSISRSGRKPISDPPGK